MYVYKNYVSFPLSWSYTTVFVSAWILNYVKYPAEYFCLLPSHGKNEVASARTYMSSKQRNNSGTLQRMTIDGKITGDET